MALPWQYLSMDEVCAAVKCKPSTLYNEIKAGRFPRPEKHRSRSLYRSDVIAALLEERSRKAQQEAAESRAHSEAKAKRLLAGRQERATA